MTLVLVSPGYFASDGYPNHGDTNNIALQGNLVKITFPLATDQNRETNNINDITYQVRYTTQPIHCAGSTSTAYIYKDTSEPLSVTAWQTITNIVAEDGMGTARMILPILDTDVTLFYEVKALDDEDIYSGPIITSSSFFALVNQPSILNISKISWVNTEGDVRIEGSIVDNGFSKPKTGANGLQWDYWRQGISSVLGDISFDYWYEYGTQGTENNPKIKAVGAGTHFTMSTEGLSTNIDFTISNANKQFNTDISYYFKIYLFGDETTLRADSNTILLYTSAYPEPYTQIITLVAQLPQFQIHKAGIKSNIPKGNKSTSGGAMFSRTINNNDTLALYDYHISSGESLPANEPSIGFYRDDNVRQALLFNRNNEVYIRRGTEPEYEVVQGVSIAGSRPYRAKNGVVHIGSLKSGRTHIEDLSGQIDGIKVEFQVPDRLYGVVNLFFNGELLRINEDYVYDGDFDITFLILVPKPGDHIIVVSSEAEALEEVTDLYDLTDQIDGVSSTFTLPEPTTGLLSLFYNGILQKRDTDYLYDGSLTIQTSTFTPEAGDIICAIDDLIVSDKEDIPTKEADLSSQITGENSSFVIPEKLLSSHLLFYNGVLQIWGNDYEYNSERIITALTFTPEPNDFLYLMYSEGIIVGDMSQSVYDKNENGIVDNSERLAGRTLDMLIDMFYPIGAYYTTSNQWDDPTTRLGGTWEYSDEASTVEVHLWKRIA